jgi:D-alanyl-D-alanine carboxypeptidase/D-alanyl-D-alanine-endopeptidase (penicillin-binding protein 4)
MRKHLMRRAGSALVFAAACVCSSAALAQTALPVQGADAASSNGPPVELWLRTAGASADSISIYVHDVSAEKPWVAHNSQAAQNPASLMKLVTTYAALELLGPAFVWRTQVSTAAEQVGDVLRGNVFIKGGGDPSLKLQDVWLMLRQLRLQGIREIRGDLVVDRSALPVDSADPAAFDGEPLRCYNVAPDALAIAAKCTGFVFRYDALANRWRVTADPAPLGMQVEADIAVGTGACGDWRAQLTSRFDLDARPPKAMFGGSIPPACGEQRLNRSFFTHRQYSASVLRQLWEGSGGRLTGQVREAGAPENTRVLADVTSPQLAEVVRDINKGSVNLAARSLLLALASRASIGGTGGDPNQASPERARQAINQWLDARGWPMPELVIDNGSGLSRTERIAAANLGRLLVGAYNSNVMPEFISSLPLVGVDGTMQKRLRGSAVAGSAHIKTGSLKNVRGIAGYVLAASGRRYAVVSLMNGEALLGAQLIHDELLKWVQEKG